MKKNKYLLLWFVSLFTFYSCDLNDNIDPKHASSVPAATLFTTAEISFVNQYDNMSVNRNICRLLSQHWMQTTYTGESRYNFLDRGIPDSYWSEFYKDVIIDLQEAKNIIDKSNYTGILLDEANNKKAIIDILSVYSFSILAETFGNIPYSEALLGNKDFTPKYDDAEGVYSDLFVKLDAAILMLKEGSVAFQKADLLFGGDVSKWKIFANSLKLKMGMRMADVPSFNSKKIVEEAVKAGVYDAAQEGAFFEYIGTAPYQNTIYKGFFVDNRNDYTPSNTLIDKMISFDDPRLSLWFTKIEDEFKGIEYGKIKGGTYTKFSHFTDYFLDPKLKVILSDYVEVEFFLAEAVERGYDVGGTAKQHYNNAIKASILYYGGTADVADEYLLKSNVNYSTAAGNWKEKIGTQKWISMYNRGVEAWTEWRRLDFPILNVPEGLKYSDIPVRFPYPFDENEMNEDNYNEAAQAIGGDEVSTKLWWDKF